MPTKTTLLSVSARTERSEVEHKEAASFWLVPLHIPEQARSLVLQAASSRLRGCGEVGRALCFPLLHTPLSIWPAMPPALVVDSPAMSAV